MKIVELFESEQKEPLTITLLRKLMAKGTPVFYVTLSDGKLKLFELYEIGDKVEYFSPNATSDIAGKPYITLKFRAPGYYSWQNRGIGQGHGDLTFGFNFAAEHDFTMKKLPSVQGRTDFVFGRKNFVNRWEREHEGK